MNIKEYKRLRLKIMQELSPKGQERLERLLQSLREDVKEIERLTYNALKVK